MSDRVRQALQRVMQNRKNSNFTVDGYTGFLFLTMNRTPKMYFGYDAMFRKLVGKYRIIFSLIKVRIYKSCKIKIIS